MSIFKCKKCGSLFINCNVSGIFIGDSDINNDGSPDTSNFTDLKFEKVHINFWECSYCKNRSYNNIDEIALTIEEITGEELAKLYPTRCYDNIRMLTAIENIKKEFAEFGEENEHLFDPNSRRNVYKIPYKYSSNHKKLTEFEEFLLKKSDWIIEYKGLYFVNKRFKEDLKQIYDTLYKLDSLYNFRTSEDYKQAIDSQLSLMKEKGVDVLEIYYKIEEYDEEEDEVEIEYNFNF